MFIAVVQFNPHVGAFRENGERALDIIDELSQLAYPPDLVVFPALALSGVELGGLVTHNAFAAEALDVAQDFMQRAALPTLIGTVLPRPAMAGTRFLCEEEVLLAVNGKGSALGFLDMNASAEMQEYVESIQVTLNGFTVTVVLDDFIDPDAGYGDSDAIISMVARPYQETNGLLTASNQIDSLRADALSNNAWIVVASLCGGEDTSVFEGASLVLAPNGSVVESAPPFEDAVFTVNLSRGGEAAAAAPREGTSGQTDARQGGIERPVYPGGRRQDRRMILSEARKQDKKKILPLVPYEANWRALTVGVRDYVHKNGFTDAVVGLSGGIDSAVVATLAADALGAEHVHCVMMPSPYSSEDSQSDAEALASNLGMEVTTFPISAVFEHFLAQSGEVLGTEGSGTARQNLQARLRTVILMHLSNTYDWLLLNTGNKSENAIGYSTLYGDTAGAIAPLGGLYKTDVYGLADWRNSRDAVIPLATLRREPSAELYSGQKDTDDLPPYDTLDQILRLHIEENLGVDEILEFFNNYPIKTVVDTSTILDVLDRVRRAEYKRRQEPMAFQFEGVSLNEHRAWPVSNGFKDHSRDIIAPGEILKYLGQIYRETHAGGFNFLDN